MPLFQDKLCDFSYFCRDAQSKECGYFGSKTREFSFLQDTEHSCFQQEARYRARLPPPPISAFSFLLGHICFLFIKPLFWAQINCPCFSIPLLQGYKRLIEQAQEKKAIYKLNADVWCFFGEFSIIKNTLQLPNIIRVLNKYTGKPYHQLSTKVRWCLCRCSMLCVSSFEMHSEHAACSLRHEYLLVFY